MLVNIDQGLYAPYVPYKKDKKILYMKAVKAICGILRSALLFHCQWKKGLIENEYIINPYDAYVANKIINGKQHTVTWHVDDLKISHMYPKVNKEFIKWID